MPTAVEPFLNELFVDGDAGQIIFARKIGDRGFLRVGAFNTIAEAEAAVRDADLYLKINRMDVSKIVARSKTGIGGKDDLVTVRAIGLDVDTAKKSPKYPPRDEVLKRLRMLGTNEPSMIVSTDGSTDGGLHLYYILSSPVVIDNSNWLTSVGYLNAVARQLREELAEILPEYQVDHCENVERLFRVAGGLRADGRRVEIMEISGARYTLDDLIRYPIEPGSDTQLIVPRQAGADSPILDYLEAIGITTVEDYMRDRMNWRQLDDTHWIREGSESNMPSGEVFQGVNGEWGVTVKTGGVPCLEQMQWYSLPALYTACEFGGDWRRSGAFCRQALASIAAGGGDPGAAGVFSRYYSEFDKYQKNDRAAAIWCYEKIDNLVYVPDVKEWRSWNGSAWVPAGELVFETVSRVMLDVSMDVKHYAKVADPKIKQKLEDEWTAHYRDYLNTRTFNGLKKALESTLYKMSWEFDESPEILHTPSLRIDLRTGERLPAELKYLNTQTTKIDPADASVDRWLNFLMESQDYSPAMVAYLKRVSGYFLTGLVNEQVMFLLHGSGQNGKSVFTQTLEYILNDYATQLDQSAVTGTLEQHPTAIASLHRRRLALASETDVGCTLREHVVKRLTGTDKLTARRMYQDFWEFMPTHKLVLSTNNMPIVRGSDEGIWRRLRVISFPVYVSNPDKNLMAKLRMESPGILNWMIDGAREYIQRGLQDPPSVMLASRELRQEMDIVGAWLDEQCELKADWHALPGDYYSRMGEKIGPIDFETPAMQLYDDFKSYCQRLTLPVLSGTAFGRRLGEKGFKNPVKGPKRLRFWEGIILKTSI